MSNLINRSELLEEIKYLSIVLNGKQIFSDDAKDTVLRIIKEQPTAYSVDKVVEELEREKSIHTENYNISLYKDYPEIKQRYKQACGVIDKTIEIVKQGGVSDDVCEWKKCSSGSADFYVYSSKCLNKNIKEIGTTTNFIDDFKYCPYCGKKIKVVE